MASCEDLAESCAGAGGLPPAAPREQLGLRVAGVPKEGGGSGFGRRCGLFIFGCVVFPLAARNLLKEGSVRAIFELKYTPCSGRRKN